MNPQGGIVGDQTGGDLPRTEVPQTDLAEERSMAKFSKTKEFKRLKQHVDQRIDFYQKYLPDGTNIGSLKGKDLETLGHNWAVANAVIGEFKTMLGAYENVAAAVKEADGRKNT